MGGVSQAGAARVPVIITADDRRIDSLLVCAETPKQLRYKAPPECVLDVEASIEAHRKAKTGFIANIGRSLVDPMNTNGQHDEAIERLEATKQWAELAAKGNPVAFGEAMQEYRSGSGGSKVGAILQVMDGAADIGYMSK